VKRAASLVAVAVVFAVAGLPFSGHAAGNLELAGETEAFALRVEYDIPLPASAGTIPEVVGEIRRTNGENSKGLAAAPTAFDAVVGGAVYDPYSTYNGNDGPLLLPNIKVGSTQVPRNTGVNPPVNPHNRLPTTECFYPGQGTNTTVKYPTDFRPGTSSVPPVSYANAQCSPGPQTQLTAWAAAADSPGYPTEPIGGVIHSGAVQGEALLRPNKGVVESSTRASAKAVTILGGVIRIGSIEAEGSSNAEGPGGKAATRGHVAITNITAAGQTFSLADDEISFGGQSFPTSSQQAHSFMDGLNASLASSGCKLAILGPAEKYPQGYLLSRKPPTLGVAKDGTYAASMNGGMLVLCDIPASISGPTTFTPQRAQILVGFEYSMARAVNAPGGFSFGGLLGGAIKPPHTVTVVNNIPGTSGTKPQQDVGGGGQGPSMQPQQQALGASPQSARVTPLAAGTRWALIAAGLILLMVATNVAARKLRNIT
jgi:hypothetical protein